jgi:hypothetical protein
LAAEKNRLFKSGESTDEVMAKVTSHYQDVKEWRQLETYYKQQAMHSPHKLTLIMADDTESFGLPKFTNRPVKATATKYRVKLSHCTFRCFIIIVPTFNLLFLLDWLRLSLNVCLTRAFVSLR